MGGRWLGSAATININTFNSNILNDNTIHANTFDINNFDTNTFHIINIFETNNFDSNIFQEFVRIFFTVAFSEFYPNNFFFKQKGTSLRATPRCKISKRIFGK